MEVAIDDVWRRDWVEEVRTLNETTQLDKVFRRLGGLAIFYRSSQ